MIKILHTADLHLRKDAERRWNTFFWICDKVRLENVDFLIISGDIFDSPSEAGQDARERMRKAFSRITPAKVIIIPGNHDIKDNMKSFLPGMFYGDNVFIGSEEPYQVFDNLGKNIVFHCIPFQRGKKARDLLSVSEVRRDPGMIHVGVLHGTLVDDRNIRFLVEEMGIEKDEYFPIEKGDIEAWGFDYLALGHIHNSFSQKVIGETTVVYPGAPEPTSINEMGERKLALITISDNKDTDVKELPVESALSIEVIGPFILRTGEMSRIFLKIAEELEKRITVGINSDIWPLVRIEGVVEDEREFRKHLDHIKFRYAERFPKFDIKDETISIVQYRDFPVCLSFIKKIEGGIEKAKNDEEKDIYRRALNQGLIELREKGGLG